jgi:prepilin-type N-terminal cleavage/methylation domain-containing protein/prepilin-type processing-associated H-X9-DG protein
LTVPRSAERSSRAFTLIELLVSVAILAVLIGILVPTLASGLLRSKDFKCQAELRRVAFDFTLFANDELHGDRGDDVLRFGKRRFALETFMESQYGVDEFWRHGDDAVVTQNSERLMGCTRAPGQLTLTRNSACADGGVTPASAVSYGFNYRLDTAEYQDVRGRWRTTTVSLTSRILTAGRVPLVIDVDGAEAERRDITPHFTAPSAGSSAAYAGDAYWFPALRHNGKAQAAFVDGSVESSADPANEPGWAWAYQTID